MTNPMAMTLGGILNLTERGLGKVLTVTYEILPIMAEVEVCAANVQYNTGYSVLTESRVRTVSVAHSTFYVLSRKTP